MKLDTVAIIQVITQGGFIYGLGSDSKLYKYDFAAGDWTNP